MKKATLLLSALLLFSCSRNLLPSGTIKQENFTETIPFNFDNGLPIIDVSIQGKTYKFLLDTGAPTVISPELAAAIKSKATKKSIVSDSQGNNSKQEFIVIDEIKIGKIHFNDIGAVVIDLKRTFEIKCLGIDGIIGSNQMSNAIWEIDYKDKKITLSDHFQNYKAPEGAAKVDFLEMGFQKTPMIKIQVDSLTSKLLTFDTGANGNVSLPYSHFQNTLKNYKQIRSYGNPSSGVYGTGKQDSVTTVKVPFMKLGTLKLENQILVFEDGSSSVLGNAFLKNYKTTINWKNKTIHLLQQDSVPEAKLETLGFGIRYINNKPVVAILTKDSNAEKQGLQLGDEIIKIDDVDFSELTEEQACINTFKSILSNKKEISLTYVRDGEKKDIKIISQVLLE